MRDKWTADKSKKWNEIYGLDKDPVRQYLIHPQLFAMLKGLKGRRVLDVGCGNGNLVYKLIGKGVGEAHGIDISEDQIEFAKANIPGGHFSVGDVEKGLPYSTGYFDSVYCVFVFNEMPEIDTTAKEMARVLKADGELFVVTIHPFFPLSFYLFEKHTGKKNPKIRNVKGYFENFRGEYLLTIANETLPFYHHTLEEIVNGMTDNGLHIAKVRELSVNKKLAEKYPRYKEYSDIPRFLMIHARKE